jgi:hypothetical protein
MSAEPIYLVTDAGRSAAAFTARRELVRHSILTQVIRYAVLYAKVPHAKIKARTIAAISIANQNHRGAWSQARHSTILPCCPIRCWMPRHLSVEDLSVGMPNYEEDVKRLEQDRSVRGALGTLANRHLGPRYAGRVPAETLNPTLPSRLGSVLVATEDFPQTCAR